MELKSELVKQHAAAMDLIFSQFKQQLAEYKATYESQLEAAIDDHEADLALKLEAKDIALAILRAELGSDQQQNSRQVSARSATMR